MKFKFILKLLYKWKLILILIFLLLTIENRKFKVCLCAIAKLENKYIIEFIEHYKKYKVDKIIIYDNNDLNSENLDFLRDYTKNNFLEIIDYRGKIAPQIKAYHECYYKHHNEFAWYLFVDIDEFINITQYSDIHDYLSQKIFNHCNSIYLNYNMHTDNDLIFYDNRSLIERFPKINQPNNFCLGKSIIKGNIPNLHFLSTHVLAYNLTICNGFGKVIKMNRILCKIPDYKFNFIEHYAFKSTEEFIIKLNRGDALFKFNNIRAKIFYYFRFNKITLEKINFIAKNLNISINYIIKQLLNKNYTIYSN